MGQILGLGNTHSPPLLLPPGGSMKMFDDALNAKNASSYYQDKANWPSEMIRELGLDHGQSSAIKHRQRQIDCFKQQRAMLDDFNPDFVIIFGDDQYENFQEDIIPPFCIFGLDDQFITKPWVNARYGNNGNAWNLPNDWEFKLNGHREGAKYLATQLMHMDFPIAYAYRLLHQDTLPQAFQNTAMFLDYEMKGFPYPVIPFQINSYGSDVIRTRGRSRAFLFENLPQSGLPDPPAPSNAMCMGLGEKLATIILKSDFKVALIGSASWSHSSLSSNTQQIIPDHASDRMLLDAMKAGNYDYWKNLNRETIEAAGQHEILNWMPLIGAMKALGRKAVVQDYIETYLFQANKVFAYFPEEQP